MEYSICHIPLKNRFEFQLCGHTAFVEYKLNNHVLTITKTFVPKELEGQGIASNLIQKVAEFCYEQGYDVKATCSYAVTWLRKHPTIIANQQ